MGIEDLITKSVLDTISINSLDVLILSIIAWHICPTKSLIEEELIKLMPNKKDWLYLIVPAAIFFLVTLISSCIHDYHYLKNFESQLIINSYSRFLLLTNIAMSCIIFAARRIKVNGKTIGIWNNYQEELERNKWNIFIIYIVVFVLTALIAILVTSVILASLNQVLGFSAPFSAEYGINCQTFQEEVVLLSKSNYPILIAGIRDYGSNIEIYYPPKILNPSESLILTFDNRNPYSDRYVITDQGFLLLHGSCNNSLLTIVKS